MADSYQQTVVAPTTIHTQNNKDECQLVLVAYDGSQARDLLRFWSPTLLHTSIQQDAAWGSLKHDEKAELLDLLQAWRERALGDVTLRDAMWVDPQRGQRVYHMLCRSLTRKTYLIPAHMICRHYILRNEQELSPDRIWNALHENFVESQYASRSQNQSDIASLIALAETEGLTLACYDARTPRYPFPDDLETLLPPNPQPYTILENGGYLPSGWRRTFSLVMVSLAMALTGVPLLTGRIPARATRLPLGLFSMGTLVGIRATWAGYTGGLFLWLAANLTEFQQPKRIAPAIFLFPGMLLLGFDHRVRTLFAALVCNVVPKCGNKEQTRV